MGIVTSDTIFYDNKAYQTLGEKQFEFSRNLRGWGKFVDLSVLNQNGTFICKVYDESDLESINFVYPNPEDKETGNDFVGYTVKYSKNLEELISYYRVLTEDHWDKYDRQPYMLKDEPTVVSKKLFLGWELLKNNPALLNKFLIRKHKKFSKKLPQ